MRLLLSVIRVFFCRTSDKWLNACPLGLTDAGFASEKLGEGEPSTTGKTCSICFVFGYVDPELKNLKRILRFLCLFFELQTRLTLKLQT